VAKPVAVASLELVETYQRSVYQPSRKTGPVAFLASAGMIAAAMAALATLNIVAKHKGAERLTVVEMKELETAPPPPPETLVKPVVSPPQVFVPKPMMQLPSPGPTQVALETPPPTAPLVQAVAPAPEAPVAAAAPAATAPSSSAVEGGDLSSQVLAAKPPVYPVEARRAREQGTVKLLVLVGPDGRVSDVAVSSSSGSKRLDQAALSAVKRWRWSPIKRDGAPVAVRGTVTIPFVLV
jgi:protein TonB